jgi:hypothetical protein
VAGVDVRVPKVGFESDWDGDWFMFPGPSELDARDWIVEVTSNAGRVRVSEWEERFSGYRELAPGQGCWGVVEARFGEIHVRFPERPDQRVCVHKWEGDLRSTSPWSMPPWTPP